MMTGHKPPDTTSRTTMLRFTLLLALVALGHARLYSFTAKVASRSRSGTSKNVYMTVIGTQGNLAVGKIHKSAFKRGRTGRFSVYQAKNIGEIKCVRLSTPARDSLLLDYITVTPEYGTQNYFYNTQGAVLNGDPRKHGGVSSLQMCKQGVETYYITTRTSTESRSQTNKLHLRMKLIGMTGNTTTTGILDNEGRNDFKRGNDDTFVVPGMKMVGMIRCIELYAEGSDKWKFDYIEVHCDNYRSAYTFHNNRNIWISNDSREGEDVFKLC